ncbi:MAG: zinc-dependent metalloprotease [Phycisphaerales bacterium]
MAERTFQEGRAGKRSTVRTGAALLALTGLALASVASAWAQDGTEGQPGIPPEALAAMKAAQGGGKGGDDKKEDFPKFDEVIKEYTKVVSTADGAASMYTLYRRDKDNQLLAELPRDFERQKLFVATTIAGGTPTAGIQFGDTFVYWKRVDKRLMLVQPNLGVRSTGDLESQKSRDNLFTDRVLLDVPIVTMSPGGGPVIDLDDLLVGQADKFFGPMTKGVNKALAELDKAKAFPQNIEVAFRMPLAAAGGSLTTLHYSWSVLPENTGYKPRTADPRVGYFTTVYQELGQPGSEQPYTRYINRWQLEKADPSLKLSPPKQPIVFFIEHTTPVRYRRWVRDGILDWNKAFEKVGIVNAVEVYQQDARSGAHMDKDPEDVRYNFFRWNSNSIGFAIGPSRVDPRTGQILDADIVMNDGFIRSYGRTFKNLVPQVAMEGFNPQTLRWLETRPQWDPRLLLADGAERQRLLAERAARFASGEPMPLPGMPAESHEGPTLLGASAYDGLANRISQVNGGCAHSTFKAMDVSLMRLGFDALDTMRLAAKPGEGSPGGGDGDDNLIDGLPEEYIGELIKEVTAHEVGHTLGLRHNFKASSLYDMKEINAAEFKGKAQVGSVMDYNPVNINFNDGPAQGDWVTPVIGPYDYWVIEYGYTAENDLKPILAKCTDPNLAYLTDEDTWGPDPYARRFDFGKDPVGWAESRMRLVQHLRSKILERAVKDGESWEKARTAYLVTLGQHVSALSVSANWVGGSFVNRDRKGDVVSSTGKSRDPIENIPAETQRRAMRLVIDNAFKDEAFGLTPELLAKMSIDKWWDEGGMSGIYEDPTYPVHERVAAVQSSAMTMLVNPTTLSRVYDNELRVPSGEDALTVAEVMTATTDAIWSELDGRSTGKYTARQPMISSLRRNLQRDHLNRLIDLTMPYALGGSAAENAVATLSCLKLREIQSRIGKALGKDEAGAGLDPYSVAHLVDAKKRIEKALDAQYIANNNPFGAFGGFMLFGQPAGSGN